MTGAPEERAATGPAVAKGGLRPLLALIRVPDWTKNLFVLAPLFFSDSFTDGAQVGRAIAAFAAFCLVASTVYVINDWCDRREDAAHPTKRTRPIASGQVSGRQALLLGGVLLAGAAAIGLAAALPPAFWIVLGAYLLMNVAYSTALRHVDLVDIAIVAAGFVLRVLAGCEAISIPASPWIILSTGLLALLLALGKRRVDLSMEGTGERGSLAGYTVEFIDIALAALAASVIAFYALFTLSDYTLEKFGTGDLYLTTFFVALGVLRYLQVVIGYQRKVSPTSIALGDRPMQAIVACWLASFALIAFT